MAANEFDITILPDGRVKVETDDFGPAAHIQADKLLEFLKEKFGGEVIIEAKKKVTHSHAHPHVHDKLKTGGRS